MPASGAGDYYSIIYYLLEAFDWRVCHVLISGHFSTSLSK